MSNAMLLAILFLMVLMFVIMTELGARISYRRNFGTGYKPKRSVDYPYIDIISKSDGPEGFSPRPGYGSNLVHLNKWGLRGPDLPSSTGVKKLLVIGEGQIFGDKLEKEEQLWSLQMKKLLEENEHLNWEIVNGGIPMFNCWQHGQFWERMLPDIKPDAIIINLGCNDIMQAWHFGPEWRPDRIWPEEIVRTRPVQKSTFQKIAENICLYYLYSQLKASSSPYKFIGDNIDWEACKDSIIGTYRKIEHYAASAGIPVAIMSLNPVFSMEPEEEEQHRLASLQLNHYSFVTHYAPYLALLNTELKEKLADELQIPYIDMYAALMANNKRFSLYYDLINWNPKGMTFTANTLYQELVDLGWWK